MSKNIFTREIKPKTNLIVSSIGLTIWVFIFIAFIFILKSTFLMIADFPNEDFSNKVMFFSWLMIITVLIMNGIAWYIINYIINNLKKDYKKIK